MRNLFIGKFVLSVLLVSSVFVDAAEARRPIRKVLKNQLKSLITTTTPAPSSLALPTEIFSAALAGRNFKYQIESLELNADNKPVLKGWMCRVGQASNTSSFINLMGGRYYSEGFSVRTDLSSICNSTSPHAGFELNANVESLDREVTFSVWHSNSGYSGGPDSQGTAVLNLGTLRSLLSDQVETALAPLRAAIPFMTLTPQVRSNETITLWISSYETYALNSSSPQATMCAELKPGVGESSACLAMTDWPSQSYVLVDADYGICSASTPSNDHMCVIWGSITSNPALFSAVTSTKKFTPASFGMGPGTYTVYYKSSYGHIVSRDVVVTE